MGEADRGDRGDAAEFGEVHAKGLTHDEPDRERQLPRTAERWPVPRRAGFNSRAGDRSLFSVLIELFGPRSPACR